MENKLQNSIKIKLEKNISEHGNIALELKKTKDNIINSIKKYKEKIDILNTIKDPKFEDVMEEIDAWGELFNNILYYTEVKLEMNFKRDIERIALKYGEKND